MIFGRNNWKPDLETREKLTNIYDEVYAYASEDGNAAILKEAKNDYHKRVGQTFEDDHDFVQRMNTFLEWFIFDYQPEGKIPGQVYTSYIERARENSDTEEMILRMEISRHRHSIFYVNEQRGNVVCVKDLVGKKSYYVTYDDNLEEGDLLESRIVTVNGKSFFTNTHCLHPKGAIGQIKNAIKKIGRDNINPDFFLTLEAKQLVWRRARQIDVKNIYNLG